MKVLHLMGPLRPSGMERMFLSAASHFKAAGVKSVIVGQGDDHPFAPLLVAAGYEVRIIPSIKSPAGAKAWATALRTERPDVTHIHPEGAFAVSAVIARATLPRTPIIRTVHNVFNPTGKAALSRRLQAFAADRVVREFIAVSSDVQENERRFKRDSRLIFNWVDDSYFNAREQRIPPTGKPAAVIVGNSSPIKNHGLALHAVLKSGMDLYFHGDESGASWEEVGILDELQADGRIRHRGTSDPTPSLLDGSVFLMPSRHEGMSIALSEALVTGLPAVVMDAPGLRWAANFPNVTVLPDHQGAWNHAVKTAEESAREVRAHSLREMPVDLSPKRGVAQYIDLYQSVTS